MDPHHRTFAIGQRLSLKGQLCTIRFIGTVGDRPGNWLGVEWDDTSRGKHNGKHHGVFYFDCRSRSSTCASFIRPDQPWDAPQTFLQALRRKYMPDFREGEHEQVFFSGKQAEEIGFQKFHARQAKLKGIRVLVFDRMCVQHRSSSVEDDDSIAQICADITELDLSRNLFETLGEVCRLCRLLPKLKVLTLDGNRFAFDGPVSLPAIKTLNLENTLLTDAEVDILLRSTAPSVEYVSLANNEYRSLSDLRLSPIISTVDLSVNEFTRLSDVESLSTSPSCLRVLILKRNNIAAVGENLEIATRLAVEELDLSYNAIQSFAFFDAIKPAVFPALRHLRVTGNPVYKSLVSADGKPLTAADGYMLTIARLPQLEYFNYSKITDKERLNTETYYLSQIAIEIGSAGEDKRQEAINRHWRYTELCAEYGEPKIIEKADKNTINPNTLAARLITVNFTLAPGVVTHCSERSWTEQIPKSFSTYAVSGLVGKRLKQAPLNLRLVLETNEQDPIAFQEAYNGPDWWDSGDEDGEDDGQGNWVLREVELTGGTRALATYTDSHDARIRIESKTEVR